MADTEESSGSQLGGRQAQESLVNVQGVRDDATNFVLSAWEEGRETALDDLIAAAAKADAALSKGGDVVIQPEEYVPYLVVSLIFGGEWSRVLDAYRTRTAKSPGDDK